MHFSIPETQDFSGYTGFNIYINGFFHCCLRFKQLHSLHEQLRRSLNLTLPQFPPKKILTLTKNELEQRRLALERYLQLIGQDPVLSKSNLLRTFLLNAQMESAFIERYETSIDVFLMNGYRISVSVGTTECSVKVLEKALRAIDLPEDFTYYFALFLIRKEMDGSKVSLVRRLMDFESPFVTLRNLSSCQIVIRKNYWDSSYDLDLMRDEIALNLLFIQSISDMEKGWIIANTETRQRLKSLQVANNKIEYMNIVRNLPSYGNFQFSNVSCDFPEPDSIVTIVIGNQELGILTVDGKQIQETKFRVTRMRCWRVTTIVNEIERKNKLREKYTYELSFEYLFAKSCLKWIKLTTDQAMFISVCLQSMVDELLNQKNGFEFNNLQALAPDYQLEYIKRDDSSIGKMSESTSDGSINSLNEMKSITKKNDAKTKKQISTSVFFKNGKEAVQNEAFENIGDDDL